MAQKTLSAAQIDLLDETFHKVHAHGESFAASFYHRLFEDHPEIEPLFAGTDMRQQAGKLYAALNTIVSSLRNPEVLGGFLGALGVRHEQSFMVRPADFMGFKDSLLRTFASYLGDEWSPEAEASWSQAFDIISSVMMGRAQRKS